MFKITLVVILLWGAIAHNHKTVTLNQNTYNLYNGHFLVNTTTNTSLFYQLTTAANKTIYDEAPIIMWMQGGPGCSSLYGTWLEFGPWMVVNENGVPNPVERNLTWASYFHIFTVDNPCQVGFNYPGTCNITNTPDAEVEVYDFLVQFFEYFYQFAGYPFYVFGESYAGKYVPYVAYDILTQGAKGFNFQGVGIGNAWTDPGPQLSVFSRMSYAAGLIDQHYYSVISQYQTQGYNYILEGSYGAGTDMFNAIENLLTETNLTDCVFLNEYRDYCATEPLEFAYALGQSYLGSPSTMESFGIPGNFNYQLCNGNVYQWYYDDFMISASDILSYVIENTRVLLFNGQDDIEVNTSGVQDFIRQLNWSGIKFFLKSQRQVWNSTVGVLGSAKTWGNFTFVTVNKAGHMVPFYQPYSALEMVLRWTNQDSNWNVPYDW